MKREVSHTSRFFYITLEDKEKAFLKYSINGKTMILESTYTPEKYRAMGFAEEITKKAIEYAQEKKLKIKPACSYATNFFQRHPEYKELLE
ncbi:MAG: GNAT family N-acetyltransferase [Candidatus Bathyarchaeota archaeon]